jgi:hypothetical protein
VLLTELVCTAPVDPFDVFPPPTWTAPVEPVALLLPVPAIDVGAEMDALAVDELAPADGLTDVLPT